MTITETICNEVVGDEAVALFQSKIGFSLPESYTQFLKLNNGGRPHPSGFEFRSREGKRERCSVHYFFGLHSGRTGNLAEIFEVFKDRIPIGLLPIARDSFGNLLLLRLGRGPDAPVFFWDHELESEGEPSMENVFLISKSFNEFIESLV